MPQRSADPYRWQYSSSSSQGFHTIISPENSECRETWIFRLNLHSGGSTVLKNDTLELSENPDFEERGIFQWIDHPTRGKVKMPAWPVKMSGNDIKVEPAPLLGEHNEEILSDWLGMSPDEIAQLKAEGAV